MPLPCEQFLVWDGLHAGVEPTGGLLVDALEAEPIPGVCTYRLDEEAVRMGVRFRGVREKGGHFRDEIIDTDYDLLDPDQQKVYDFVTDDTIPLLWGGIDVHTTIQRNGNALICAPIWSASKRR